MAKSDYKLTSEQIQIEGKSPVTVFHLSGWLDAHSEKQLETSAQEAYESGVRYLVLDLADIETLTSAGMRAIERVYKLFTPRDDKTAYLKLCSAPPQVYHVLGITGFLLTMPMYENLQAALDSFEA